MSDTQISTLNTGSVTTITPSAGTLLQAITNAASNPAVDTDIEFAAAAIKKAKS